MSTPVYESGVTVPVSVSVPLDSSGAPLTVSAASVTVHDERGNTITTLTPSIAGVTDTLSFMVDGAHNTLDAGVRKGARQVKTRFTTPQGDYSDFSHYVLQADTQLTVLTNSFQTYPEALMTRSDLPALDGWDAATDSSRMAALMIAHWNMCGMRYRYRIGLAGQSRIADFGGTQVDPWRRTYAIVSDIRNTMQWEWDQFPEDFTTALKRAQVVEADTLLRGDPVGDKRRAGIISETIGESSMFLRQVPEVRLAVSREALSHLKGFIENSTRLVRV